MPKKKKLTALLSSLIHTTLVPGELIPIRQTTIDVGGVDIQFDLLHSTENDERYFGVFHDEKVYIFVTFDAVNRIYVPSKEGSNQEPSGSITGYGTDRLMAQIGTTVSVIVELAGRPDFVALETMELEVGRKIVSLALASPPEPLQGEATIS